MNNVQERDKTIGNRRHKIRHRIRHNLFNHWCLHRSRLIYCLLGGYCRSELRINISVRCRDNVSQDWGHAWVSLNGKPIFEHSNNIRLTCKPMTMVADTGRYIYWIYE